MGPETFNFPRVGIAVLDAAGRVTWTDEAWAADGYDGDFLRAPIGTNLLQAYRGQNDPTAHAIAGGIAAVFGGTATYFEIEHRSSRETPRTILTSVAALRGDGAGAVVIHRVGGASRTIKAASTTPTRATGLERFTPREREVLGLMASGLDNRAIAARLQIQYTTVRGHVRSVIEKLGSRSRLEAVARAYQMGVVPR